MTEKIRWAIWGDGVLSEQVVTTIKAMDDSQFMACLKTDKDLKEHKDNLDIVFVSNHLNGHLATCLNLLDEGLPFVSARPLSVSIKDVREILSKAEEKDLFIMEACWSLFLPAFQNLKMSIEAGEIGTPTMLVAGGGYLPSEKSHNRLFDRNYGGGVLLDATVDLIAMAQALFGVPLKTKALASLGNNDLDEQDVIILQFTQKRLANLYVTMHSDQPPFLTVLGTKGQIQLAPPAFASSVIEHIDQVGDKKSRDFAYEGPYMQFALAEANRCLRENLIQSPFSSWEQTKQLSEILNEIRLQVGLRFYGE